MQAVKSPRVVCFLALCVASSNPTISDIYGLPKAVVVSDSKLI